MRPIGSAGAICALVLTGTLGQANAQHPSGTHARVPSREEQALHDLLVKAKAEADSDYYAAAQADYETYLKQRPKDAAAHFDLGYVYTAQHQTEKAIAEYRNAITLDPKMIDAQLNLGISLLPSDPKASIPPLEKVIELNYAFERGHYMLGAAEERSGNAAAAEKEYEIAVKLDPNDVEAHGALARIDLANKKPDAAEGEFRELLRLKPGDSQGTMGLAQSLLEQKKTSDAVAALATYLNANPNDARARLMEASALVDLGKNDDALDALDQAAQHGPETVETLKLRSVIYYRQSDFAKAVPVLKRASAMAPQDASIHARLGYALIETKDYPGAMRELKQSLELDPSSTDTLRDLATADYLGKDFAGTLTVLDTLSRREPLNASAWFVRASCYDHINQPEAALAAYQKFLAMNTDKNSDQYFVAAARARFLEAMLKRKGH